MYKLWVKFFGLILLLCVFSNLWAHEMLTEEEGKQQKTRYKIFTAEHEAVLGNGKVVKVNSIFKIDLDTGTVWRYRQGVDNKGKTYEEFFEVPNQ